MLRTQWLTKTAKKKKINFRYLKQRATSAYSGMCRLLCPSVEGS